MRRLALAAVLAAAFATPSFAQKVGETIDVGGWKLSSSTNKDGSTGCSATFVYDDKSLIGFSIDNDNFTAFLVSEPTAKMTAGQKYQVKFRIDSGKTVTGMGIATDATMVVVPVPDTDVNAVFKAFMAGNSLFITMGGTEFEEPLQGSNDALLAMANCARGMPPRGK